MLMDKHGDDQVDSDSYKNFWQQYVYMYANVMHDPLSFDVNSSDLITSTFDYISNIRNKPTDRPNYAFRS